MLNKHRNMNESVGETSSREEQLSVVSMCHEIYCFEAII